MPPRPGRFALLPLVIACAVTPPAHAQWSGDPAGNLAVSVADGQQTMPQVVTDGSGGSILAWYDGRPGLPGIYAQRLDAAGVAQWTANGLAVTTASAAWNPSLASDGAGGVIVAWTDYRSGSYHGVYAQRLGPDGSRLWGPDGVAVSTITVGQNAPVRVTSDGAAGAVVTWAGSHPYSATRVFVQRLDAAGARQWPAEVPLGQGTAVGCLPQVAPDGDGGVIVTWLDYRQAGYDLYVQRVGGTGEVLWGAGDVIVCAVPGPGRQRPGIASDAAGGAIVSWIERRNVGGTLQANLFLQRFGPGGSPLWSITGVQVSQDGGAVSDSLLADGHGGVFAAWYDTGLRAQHVGGSGVATWAPGGVPVAPGHPRMLYDLAGGFGDGLLVCWADDAAASHIRAQSLGEAGERRWGAAGLAVSTASGAQFWPAMLGDGAGGAAIAWADVRNDGTPDIYAQRVTAGGTLDAGPPAPAAAFALAAAPTPARAGDGVTLRLALPSAAAPRVAIFDLAGRRVATLSPGASPAGVVTLRWDGRGADGRSVPPGLYLVRAEAGGRAATARIVVTN